MKLTPEQEFWNNPFMGEQTEEGVEMDHIRANIRMTPTERWQSFKQAAEHLYSLRDAALRRRHHPAR